MSQERNWAEHEIQMQNPTIEQARGTGWVHAGYGWSKNPWGHWSDELKQSYADGWQSYHDGEPKPVFTK